MTMQLHNGQTTALATGGMSEDIERVLMRGDLKALTPDQRVHYYRAVCDSVGLNPLTQPFSYLELNGKLVLYATRACSDQLRSTRRVSLTIASREMVGELYVVTARATTPDGRHDESTGAVAVGNLKGESLANALMKAETKAKRRVTLSICGLSLLDETEVDSVVGARRVVPVDPTGAELADADVLARDLAERIAAADTLDALKALAAEVKRLPATFHAPLREAYAARMAVLKEVAS